MSLLLCFVCGGVQTAFATPDWGLGTSSLSTITANQTVVLKECPSTMTVWSSNSYLNSGSSGMVSTIDYSCVYKFIENGTVNQGGTDYQVYVLYNVANGKYLSAENTYTENINDAFQLVASHAETATSDNINGYTEWTDYYNKTSLDVSAATEQLWVFCKKDGKTWLNVVGNPGVQAYHDTNLWLIYSVEESKVESAALTAEQEAACAKVDAYAKLSAVYGTVDAAAIKAQINAVTVSAGLDAAINEVHSLVAAQFAPAGAFYANNKSILFSNKGDSGRLGLHITAGNLDYSDTSKAYGTNSTDKNVTVWTIKENGDGTFKLYNAFTGLYLGTASSSATLSADPANGANYSFVIRDTNVASLQDHAGNILHQYSYWSPSYAYGAWNPADNASNWDIESVEIASEEVVNAFGTNRSRFLNIAYSYFQDKYGLVKDGEKITVVKNHPSGSDSQPSSNLLDGNKSTFVHTAYGTGDESSRAADYIQVELSEPQEKVLFYMSRRNANNRPKTIEVYVSEDGTTFGTTPVATLTGLHLYGDPYYSDAINLGGSYKYVRFTVKETNTGSKFFTASEFYVLPINSETTLLNEYFYVYDVTNVTSAVVEAQNAFLVSAETYGPKKEAAVLLTENASNHADAPALGQYTTTGYNALQAAVDNATITLDEFNAVMDQFNRAQNRPVFLITSAHDGGYCGNNSIYDNGSAWKWAAKNYYDRSMFITVKDLTATEMTAETAYNLYNYVTGRPVYYDGTVTLQAVSGKEGVFNLKVNTGNGYLHCQAAGNSLVTWYACAPNEGGTDYNNLASSWRIEYVGNSYDFDQISSVFPERANELLNLTIACTSANFGSALGQFSGVDYAGVLEPAINEVNNLKAKENTTRYSVTNAQVVSALDAFNNALAGATMNQPAVGKFYRFKNVASNKYLTSNLANSRMVLESPAAGGINTKQSVFYLAEGNKLVAYENGLFTQNFTSGNYGFEAAGSTGSAVAFAQGNPVNSATSCYHLTCGGRTLYGNGSQIVDEITYTAVDGGNSVATDNTDAAYDWVIEEVAYLPVSVSETVKYGTLYTPVELQLRENLSAYTGSVNGEWLTLNPLTDVIPAGSAVVLKDTGAARDSETRCIYLQVSNGTAAAGTNRLTGSVNTVLASTVTSPYTLQNPAEGLGFYPYSGETLAGFKAYLAGLSGVRGFVLQEGEATLIEGVEGNVDFNQPVYDLSGRRVKNAQKGIYIIGGKKVILK